MKASKIGSDNMQSLIYIRLTRDLQTKEEKGAL